MPIVPDNDLLLDAADALVDALDDAPDGTFSTSFTPAWQADPLLILSDADPDETLVWIIDHSESHATSNVGVPLAELPLSIIVQRKLPVAEETQAESCRALSLLVSQITQWCRRNSLSVDGCQAVCFKTDRNPARDWKALREDNLYRAEVTTYWRMVFPDDEEG